jgi:hypothetical protein
MICNSGAMTCSSLQPPRLLVRIETKAAFEQEVKAVQSDSGRVTVSIAMWIVIGVIGTTAVFNVNMETWAMLPIIAILMFGGAAGMMALWRRMPWESEGEISREQAEKGKRRGKVERLMDGLSDQEREELLTRLTEADGEVSLDDVLRRR